MPATLSIRGLYTINNSLFSGMIMPDGMNSEDRQIIIDNILNEYAEFEILYPDPIFMQDAVTKWSAKEVPTWQRIYNLAMKEYNPIENYNRTEVYYEHGVNQNTQAHSGTDVSSSTGSSTTTGNDRDTNSGSDTLTTNKAGFDSNTLVTSQTDTNQHGHIINRSNNQTTNDNGSASLVHGENINNNGSNTIDRTGHISGNIGVTTSQQMAEQELLVSPKLNVYNYIMESFKNRFCLEVY